MKPKNIDINKDKGLNIFDEGENVHLIYSLELPLEERLKKVVSMPSAQAAADFLGTKLETLFSKRVVGKRIQSNIDGKLYAVRIKPKNK